MQYQSVSQKFLSMQFRRRFAVYADLALPSFQAVN